jgi:hypothetical protein
MQYAAHLPNTRAMVAPVLALAIGAAGATGVYAALDNSTGSAQPAPIVVKQTSRNPVASGPNEASVAASVARPPAVSASFGKDESSTAAAVGSSSAGSDEASVASAIGGAH